MLGVKIESRGVAGLGLSDTGLPTCLWWVANRLGVKIASRGGTGLGSSGTGSPACLW